MTGTKNTLLNTVTKVAKNAVKPGYFVKDSATGVSHSDLGANDDIYGFNQLQQEAGKDTLVSPLGSPGVFQAVANEAVAAGEALKVIKGQTGDDVVQNGRVGEADTAGDEIVGYAETAATKAGEIIDFTMRSTPAVVA